MKLFLLALVAVVSADGNGMRGTEEQPPAPYGAGFDFRGSLDAMVENVVDAAIGEAVAAAVDALVPPIDDTEAGPSLSVGVRPPSSLSTSSGWNDGWDLSPEEEEYFAVPVTIFPFA